MSIALTSLTVFAASQVGTPGPANMALMATGARFGFRAALPFVLGVALGKQLIIWPIGFGLMGLADSYPGVFTALKWASAAYILWLAWRVANLRLGDRAGATQAPGFLAGLIVHPLNPKAWAMIVAAFTGFIGADIPTFQATFTVAAVLLSCQLILHPIWTLVGDKIAQTVAGRPQEQYLMWTLAGLTAASVLYVLIGGGGAQ